MSTTDEAQRREIAKLFGELAQEAPDLTLHSSDRRSWEIVEVLYQVVIFFANVTGAAGFVELVRRVVRRRPDLSLRVRYKDTSGAVQTFEVTGGSADEVIAKVDFGSVDGGAGAEVQVRRR